MGNSWLLFSQLDKHHGTLLAVPCLTVRSNGLTLLIAARGRNEQEIDEIDAHPRTRWAQETGPGARRGLFRSSVVAA
jgi:hypothetical protein